MPYLQEVDNISRYARIMDYENGCGLREGISKTRRWTRVPNAKKANKKKANTMRTTGPPRTHIRNVLNKTQTWPIAIAAAQTMDSGNRDTAS